MQEDKISVSYFLQDTSILKILRHREFSYHQREYNIFEFFWLVETQEYPSLLKCAQWIIFWFARGTQLQVFFFKIFLFKISLLKCDNWTIFNPTSLKGAITWYYFKFYIIKIFPNINTRTRFQFLLKRENKLSVSFWSTHYYFIQKKLIILSATRRYSPCSYILNSTSSRILILLQDGLNENFTRRYYVLIF